jgi:hypothetical protein
MGETMKTLKTAALVLTLIASWASFIYWTTLESDSPSRPPVSQR